MCTIFHILSCIYNNFDKIIARVSIRDSFQFWIQETDLSITTHYESDLRLWSSNMLDLRKTINCNFHVYFLNRKWGLYFQLIPKRTKLYFATLLTRNVYLALESVIYQTSCINPFGNYTINFILNQEILVLYGYF